MKKILVFLVICIYFKSEAQLVTIVDSASNSPIFLAHVFIKGTSHGVVSNEDGLVNLSSFSTTDQISISHISYKEVTIEKAEILDNQIALSPLDIALSEIVVSDISAYQVLRKAIERQKKHIPEEATHTGYYREYVSCNDEYTRYADGQIVYSTNYSHKRDKYKTKPSVIQSRVHSSESKEEFDLDVASFIDIETLIEYNLVEDLGGFLVSKNQEDYVYEFGSSPNPDFYLILIEPVSGIEKMLYSAKLLIHTETLLIHELTFGGHSDFARFGREISLFGVHVKILNWKGQLRFEEVNGLSYLKYGKISLDIFVKTKIFSQQNSFTSEILVYDFEPKASKKMKAYGKRSLYESEGEYHDNFWESGNAIPLGAKEKKLIEEVTTNLKTTTE